MTSARAARLAPCAVLLAAVSHNLWYTWLRWGDPVVDCGRELEVARLVAEGSVLYRDVRHYYGPLAPYVNGVLFAIFGPHAGVLMAAGVLSVLLMAVAVYALTRRLSDRLAATVAATAFIYLCAFGHLYFNGIFNWVMPYTYSATYGMLAATASLLLLVRHLQEARAADLWLSVACLLLAALGKIELLLPVLGAHAVFVASVRPRLGAYVAGIGVGLTAAGFLILAVGPRLVDDYLRFALSPRFGPILSLHSGVAFWQQALEAVGLSAVVFAAVLALVAVGARLDRARWMPWGRLLTTVACAAGAWLAFRWLSFFDQLRALPLLLGAALVSAFVRWWRAPAERTNLPSVLLLVFALGCLVRVPLASGVFHFGFYLLPVPLVALAVFWFQDLPRYLPGRSRQVSVAAGLGLFAALIVTHYRVSRDMYDGHNSVVRGPRGTMRVLDGVDGFPEGRAYVDAVQLLAQYPPRTRVLAVPEGVGLGFLAGLTSVCGMHSFKPPEMDGPFEDRLLACLETAPPDLVVRVGIDLSEFGSRGFGIDYAEHVDAWIRAQYQPVAAFGPGGYVLVLRR